jgi:hypothetical protein
MLALVLLTGNAPAETNVAATLIPFDSISTTNRALVRSVTDHYTLRREYDAREFKARKQNLDYLMDHLDACSVLSETVGLIQYRATGDAQGRFFADNHEGARGYIVEAYSGDGKRIYFVQGTEQGVFKIEGRGVAVIDYAQTSTNTIRYTGAMFVKVDNVVIAVLAQLFGVFVRGTVDHHFDHVLHHPIKLSEMALSDPQFLLDKIRQTPETDRTLLTPFAELLGSGTNNPAR